MTLDQHGHTNGAIKALVVDDNSDVGLLLGRILEHENIQTAAVADGVEALQALAKSELPDVVLLDVQMPGMDGWETLEAIRNNPRTADVRVVMCTVKAGTSDVLRAWQLGCDGWVGKPFEIDELLGEVRCVVGRQPKERSEVRSKEVAEAREALKETSR